MKKILVFLLSVVFVLASCSKDETYADIPKNGQYIYENKNLLVAVYVHESIAGITIFENGKWIYQDLRGSVHGSWPTYRYEYGGYRYVIYMAKLVLDCQYAENTAFVATVSDNQTEINLPTIMQFRFDKRILDINGDGILDVMQPDLFSR